MPPDLIQLPNVYVGQIYFFVVIASIWITLCDMKSIVYKQIANFNLALDPVYNQQTKEMREVQCLALISNGFSNQSGIDSPQYKTLLSIRLMVLGKVILYYTVA